MGRRFSQEPNEHSANLKKHTQCTTVGWNPEQQTESLPEGGRIGNLDALSNGHVEGAELPHHGSNDQFRV